MYDLLIRDGSIYDGTGTPSYSADIGVADGEIVAIGRLEGEAAKTVNASGLAVSPGFIDLHTHSDMSFLLDSTAQSKVRPSTPTLSMLPGTISADTWTLWRRQVPP
jgi:N-acyl-D-aspartate/D-glutamate deacylase